MTVTPRHLALLAGTFFAATAAIDIPHTQAQPFEPPPDVVHPSPPADDGRRL